MAIIWVGALLVMERNFSVGMLFAFLAYKEQFSTRFAGLIDKLVELKMLKLQGERLADIVLSEPEAEQGALLAAEQAEGAPVRLELRGVGFRLVLQ